MIVGNWTVSWTLALIGSSLLLKIKRPKYRSTLIFLYPLLVALIDWLMCRTDYEHFLSYPFSDATGYLSYGLGLTKNYLIGTWGGRRPFYSMFLGSLFTVGGPSLIAVLALQAILQGVAFVLFNKVLERRFDRAAAATAFLVLTLFGNRFFGNTLTENLGLPLGVLALAILLYEEKVSLQRSIVAIFVLSLAMFSRAGAFFSIPAVMLVLWYSLLNGNPILSRRSFTVAGAVGVAAVAPYLLLHAATKWLVVPGSLPFSNFSYTLYGLVRGGQAWNQIFNDYPQLLNEPSDVMRSRMIYEMAFESVRNEPGRAITGIFRAWMDFIRPSMISAYGFMGSGAPKFLARIPSILFAALGGLGLYYSFRARFHLHFKLLIALSVGVLLSVPFVQPIDADSMRAFAVSIPLFAIFAGLGVLQAADWWAGSSDKTVDSVDQARISVTALYCIACVYVLLVFSPFLRAPFLTIGMSVGSSGDQQGTYAFTVLERGRWIENSKFISTELSRFGYEGGPSIAACLEKIGTARFSVGKRDYDSLQYLLIHDPRVWEAMKEGRSVRLFPIIKTSSPLQVFTDDARCQ